MTISWILKILKLGSIFRYTYLTYILVTFVTVGNNYQTKRILFRSVFYSFLADADSDSINFKFKIRAMPAMRPYPHFFLCLRNSREKLSCMTSFATPLVTLTLRVQSRIFEFYLKRGSFCVPKRLQTKLASLTVSINSFQRISKNRSYYYSK